VYTVPVNTINPIGTVVVCVVEMRIIIQPSLLTGMRTTQFQMFYRWWADRIDPSLIRKVSKLT
jgi:hypothetical protein